MTGALARALDLLPTYLAAHVRLSAAALALGIALSLPLTVWAARSRRAQGPLLAFARLVQTIPALALLALFYPLLLGLRALSGLPVPALGFLPSVLALTLYAMLPILRTGVTGLQAVDRDVLEAADGVGMTPGQKLLQVEIPLALPMLMAGIRTAAVWTIGAATLATPVGQTSLGNFIFTGLQTEDWTAVLVGCAASAALAVLVDSLLGLIEQGLIRRHRARIGIALVSIVTGFVLALLPLGTSTDSGNRPVTIGAKNFSEQFILAALLTDRLSDANFTVRRIDGLGSAVAYRALAANDIDVYVDYAGTLWGNVLGRSDRPSRATMLALLRHELARRDGVTLLGTLGFENRYAFAMKRDEAQRLGIHSIADLARMAPKLRLGTDLEFLSRPDWEALRTVYGLRFTTIRSYTPTFMYRALASGAVDIISAFSSDGRIIADNLLILSDPLQAIPAYDAVLLLAPKHQHDRRLITALRPLLGSISVAQMQQANLMIDRVRDKRSPDEAAHWLSKQHPEAQGGR